MGHVPLTVKHDGQSFSFDLDPQVAMRAFDPSLTADERADAIDDAIQHWRDTPQGQKFWVNEKDRLRNGDSVTRAAHAALRKWIALAQAQEPEQASPVSKPVRPSECEYVTITSNGRTFDVDPSLLGRVLDANESARDKSDALSMGIRRWSDTPQGADYWGKACGVLENGGKLSGDALVTLLEYIQLATIAKLRTEARHHRLGLTDHELQVVHSALVEYAMRVEDLYAANSVDVSEQLRSNALVARDVALVCDGLKPKPPPPQERVVLETDMSIFDV